MFGAKSRCSIFVPLGLEIVIILTSKAHDEDLIEIVLKLLS